MKKQETVERNFTKVLEEWELSRQRKIKNLEKQRIDILQKAVRLSTTVKRIDAEIQRISQLEPPKAPTKSKRESQRQTQSEIPKLDRFTSK